MFPNINLELTNDIYISQFWNLRHYLSGLLDEDKIAPISKNQIIFTESNDIFFIYI